MTKQHFIALAREINSMESREHRMSAARAVAVVALEFNPRFDSSRFYTACGL